MEEAYKFLEQKIYDFEHYIDAMESYPEDYDENVYNDYVEELKEYKNILNELERLQKENELLENTKDTCPEMATSGFRCHLKNALNFEKTVHTCLHCGNDTPLYCENCYQELISKNGELQLEIEQEKQYYIKKCGDCTELSFKLDNCIPKQVLKKAKSGLI